MATILSMPKWGLAMKTGLVAEWLKQPGEPVQQGEPVVQIESEKATDEVESPVTGIMRWIEVKEGDSVPVGASIAVITAPNEELSDEQVIALLREDAEVKRQKAEMLTGQLATAKTPAVAPPGGTVRAPVAAGARVNASPVARRMAQELGIDLATVTGTGPGGMIGREDVLCAAEERKTVFEEQAPLAPIEVAEAVPATEQPLVLSNIWRIMAERTTQSWTSVPHFYLVREVNVSRLITWREQILKQVAEKVTYTDLLVKIVAAALRMHPRVNASWNDGKITLKQEVHVGLAVAVEEGLVVPVIHQADTLSLGEIARQRMELVAKAQAGKLRPVDISDGTFTISNLGMYNVDAVNAIINQPQAAILAVGRITERVVPVNGQPAVQPMMVLTLSCDHRAIDGARGAQFLDTVANYVEEPLGLLG